MKIKINLSVFFFAFRHIRFHNQPPRRSKIIIHSICKLLKPLRFLFLLGIKYAIPGKKVKLRILIGSRHYNSEIFVGGLGGGAPQKKKKLFDTLINQKYSKHLYELRIYTRNFSLIQGGVLLTPISKYQKNPLSRGGY